MNSLLMNKGLCRIDSQILSLVEDRVRLTKVAVLEKGVGECYQWAKAFDFVSGTVTVFDRAASGFDAVRNISKRDLDIAEISKATRSILPIFPFKAAFGGCLKRTEASLKRPRTLRPRPASFTTHIRSSLISAGTGFFQSVSKNLAIRDKSLPRLRGSP